MSMLTVRDLDPKVKEKLRRRAARHGRSMEAEARLILAAAVETGDEPVDLIASIRQHFAGTGIALDFPIARTNCSAQWCLSRDHSRHPTSSQH